VSFIDGEFTLKTIRFKGAQVWLVPAFLNRRLQAEHTAFANQWLRNIAAQQGIL